MFILQCYFDAAFGIIRGILSDSSSFVARFRCVLQAEKKIKAAGGAVLLTA
jgi:hypothetical protein